jgi:hypothetical protein
MLVVIVVGGDFEDQIRQSGTEGRRSIDARHSDELEPLLHTGSSRYIESNRILAEFLDTRIAGVRHGFLLDLRGRRDIYENFRIASLSLDPQ